MFNPKTDIVSKNGNIYIRGILHVAIDWSLVIGIYSHFKETIKSEPNCSFVQTSSEFYIDIFYRNGEPMRLRYDDFDKWKRVLSLLNRQFNKQKS